MKNILLIAFCCISIFVSCATNKEYVNKNNDSLIEDNKFQLIIEADKKEINLGESISIKCRFINKTEDIQDVTIHYETESENLRLHIFNLNSEPDIGNFAEYVGESTFNLPPKLEMNLLPDTEWACNFLLKSWSKSNTVNKPTGYTILDSGEYKISISYFKDLQVRNEVMRSNTININVR